MPELLFLDDDPGLLTRIRGEASCLSFPPRNTVRCDGAPLFRSPAARDVGCLLDVDPTVISWTCLPTVIEERGTHVPDFMVHRAAGTTLVDVVPAQGTLSEWIRTAVVALGYRHEIACPADHGDVRLANARALLRYANWQVSLGDRVRLLAILAEDGPLPIGACMHVIRDRDAMGTIANLALHRFIEIELDDVHIGPDTRVNRFRG